LKPGLSYVIDPSTTLDAFSPFNSRKEMFSTLFPKKTKDLGLINSIK
jgi:hypothetical protein